MFPTGQIFFFNWKPVFWCFLFLWECCPLSGCAIFVGRKEKSLQYDFPLTSQDFLAKSMSLVGGYVVALVEFVYAFFPCHAVAVYVFSDSVLFAFALSLEGPVGGRFHCSVRHPVLKPWSVNSVFAFIFFFYHAEFEQIESIGLYIESFSAKKSKD